MPERARRRGAIAVAGGALILAALVPSARAAAPFKRGVLLRGTVVTMDGHDRVLRNGNVLVRDGRIAAIWQGRRRPRRVHVGRPVVVAPPGALIFPGLINLHDHPTWAMLPVKPAPSSDAQPAFGRPTGAEPYANRYQWNGAGGFDDVSLEHRRLVQGPQDVLASSGGLGLDSESVKWAEARALLGGETADQGAAGDPATDALMARNVDGVNFGRDRVESETFPAADPGLRTRLRAGRVDAFIAHVAEGVRNQDRRPGDAYSSRAEFSALRRHGLLTDATVIVHGTALERADFATMRAARTPRRRGDGLGAKLVWSPLSNLLLYGHTANVYQALAEGVTVALGTDWSPSGSGNLLQELKVADIALRDPALLGGGRRLVPSLRSEAALDQVLVAMVTRNPARALRWGRRVGSVAAGRTADLTVITRPPGSPARPGVPASPYRSLIDATERDVRLTMVGGDPLAGDPALMRALKRGDFELVPRTRTGVAKAIDVTKAGVPEGSESLAQIEGALRDGLAALGGADGYAYLRAHVANGAFAGATEAAFRLNYLEPKFGLGPGRKLNAEAIDLAPLLPEDDRFRLRVIEGERDAAGAIAGPGLPFGPYAANVNQIPPGSGNPFAGFAQRWYR